MKNNLMIILVTVIVISFFLPWISVESQAIGSVTKLLTGESQGTISSISGYSVPVLANSDESRTIISIIKIFQPGITDADKKSFLIWGVPLLAVAMFFLSHIFSKQKWVKLAISVISVSIFAIATYKITSTDLNKLVLNITIGYGLWLVLIGYLGIGIVQLLDFLKLNRASV